MGAIIKQLVERTFHEVAGATTQEAAGIYFYQIESFFPEALRDLVEMALNGAPLPRQYLTALFTIVNVAGRYPLTGHPTLETRSIPKAVVRAAADAVEFPLRYVPNPEEIRYPQPGPDFVYYTIQNEVIITRDTNGELDTLIGSITIDNGIFRPVIDETDGSLTTLPEQIEHIFIGILKGMVQMKRGGGAPQQASA